MTIEEIESGEIESKIYVIRGEKVMLDEDLARLYQVPTMRLNEQVKRNQKRFPPDFMFRLSNQEVVVLTSQIAISSGRTWGGRRRAPLAFTEQKARNPKGLLARSSRNANDLLQGGQTLFDRGH